MQQICNQLPVWLVQCRLIDDGWLLAMLVIDVIFGEYSNIHQKVSQIAAQPWLKIWRSHNKIVWTYRWLWKQKENVRKILYLRNCLARPGPLTQVHLYIVLFVCSMPCMHLWNMCASHVVQLRANWVMWKLVTDFSCLCLQIQLAHTLWLWTVS